MKKYSLLTFFVVFTLAQSFAQIDFALPEKPIEPLLTEMDSLITAGKYERITSVLVAHNSKLVFEKYYSESDSTTLHNTRSATKSIATLLTGIAIDQGHIKSEQDKILTYLQHKLPCKNPDKRKEAITIEDLLTMSSILESDDGNYFSRGHEERMYIIEDWTQFFIDLPIRSYPFNPPPAEQPYGRSFSYSSAQASAVSEIVQTAIKREVDGFAKEFLLTPLGITDYKLHYTPMNILNTAGGSEYRSRDFLKLIQMCINRGVWKGQQIVTAAWLEKATSPKANVFEGVDYGYFFWLKSFGESRKVKAYYMSGNGGNKIMALPELNLTVVITTTNYNNRNAHNYTDELLDKYIIPTFME